MNTYPYKGIVLAGSLASGKTTVSLELAHLIPKAQTVEVSRLVIQPASNLETLPKNAEDFGASLVSVLPTSIPLDRSLARDTFDRITRLYGSDIIGKCIVAQHLHKYVQQFLIVSGARGFETMKFLKDSGYLVVYIEAPKDVILSRLIKERNITKSEAIKEYRHEEELFKTSKIATIADLVLDSHLLTVEQISSTILRKLNFKECAKCLNNTNNPTITIEDSGLCSLCSIYEKNFNPENLKKELAFLKSLVGVGKEKKFDTLVGISGGKDSTATLYTVKELGFNPLAVTFDIGYYPAHILKRSKQIAKKLQTPLEVIDIHSYIREVDYKCYKATATLYNQPENALLAERFRELYSEGRAHYSAKSRTVTPFVRTCQLCRRVVIRAYYDQAVKHGVKVLILGINEWAGLSQDIDSKVYKFSAIRKLKPYDDKPAVYIVHLPFLLQRTISDTEEILNSLGWEKPANEDLIESNSNSCLFAKAAEGKAFRMLGFHPDTTRLSREITVGFINKEQARKALKTPHSFKSSVEKVLKQAKIL